MSKTVTLTFLPASEPPDDNRYALVTDGRDVLMGWFHPGRKIWVDMSEMDGADVKAWADLPKAEECLERENG